MELYERVGSINYKKRSAACFFLPAERGEPSLDELAHRVGIKDVALEDPPGSGRIFIVSEWGGIHGLELCLERRPQHYLFEIQFFTSDLYRLMRDPRDQRSLRLEEEPYYPLVLAFRDACLALDPEMAIITSLEGHDHRWVREQIEPKLLAQDADGIMEGSGLIYMNEALYRRWYYYDMWLMPHDRIPVDRGRGALVFSGEGRKCWW